MPSMTSEGLLAQGQGHPTGQDAFSMSLSGGRCLPGLSAFQEAAATPACTPHALLACLLLPLLQWEGAAGDG
jgi:hypothetical protein